MVARKFPLYFADEDQTYDCAVCFGVNCLVPDLIFPNPTNGGFTLFDRFTPRFYPYAHQYSKKLFHFYRTNRLFVHEPIWDIQPSDKIEFKNITNERKFLTYYNSGIARDTEGNLIFAGGEIVKGTGLNEQPNITNVLISASIHGLMQVVIEPYSSFVLTVETCLVGSLVTDIDNVDSSFFQYVDYANLENLLDELLAHNYYSEAEKTGYNPSVHTIYANNNYWNNNSYPVPDDVPGLTPVYFVGVETKLWDATIIQQPVNQPHFPEGYLKIGLMEFPYPAQIAATVQIVYDTQFATSGSLGVIGGPIFFELRPLVEFIVAGVNGIQVGEGGWEYTLYGYFTKTIGDFITANYTRTDYFTGEIYPYPMTFRQEFNKHSISHRITYTVIPESVILDYLEQGLEGWTFMPDSIRIKAIYDALDAGKYSTDPNNSSVPRVSNLGRMIERTARVNGISENPDGTIKAVRQRAVVENTGQTVFPSGYYQGQFGVNPGGSTYGQIGGNPGEERDGIIYQNRSNTFAGDSNSDCPNDFSDSIDQGLKIQSGSFVLCENWIQYIEALLDDLDKGLNWQEMGAGSLPAANGEKKYCNFEGMGTLLSEMAYALSALSGNIQRTEVLAKQTAGMVQELIGIMGVPLELKSIETNIKQKDKGKIPYWGFTKFAPTLTEQNGWIMQNLAPILGSLLELPPETKEEVESASEITFSTPVVSV